MKLFNRAVFLFLLFILNFQITILKLNNINPFAKMTCAFLLHTKKFVSCLGDLIASHFTVLIHDLDVLKEGPLYGKSSPRDLSRRRKKKEETSQKDNFQANLNTSYLLPTAVNIVTVVDSVLQFYSLEDGGGFYYTIDRQIQAPRMFFHLIWPAAFWEVSDLMMAIAISMCLVIYPRLLMDARLANHNQNKFTMYLFRGKAFEEEEEEEGDDEVRNGGNQKVEIVCNGKRMAQAEAEAMFRFWKKAGTVMRMLNNSTFMVIEIFFFWYFFLAWKGDTAHDYLMFVLVVLYVFYMCTGEVTLEVFSNFSK